MRLLFRTTLLISFLCQIGILNGMTLPPDSLYHHDNGDKIYLFSDVDTMAIFPGGETGMTEWMSHNITYPGISRKFNIEGTVYCTFVVEKDGSVSDILILQGIDKACNNEVLRLIKKSPRWTPAIKGGEAVRVQFNLPVNFKLEE